MGYKVEMHTVAETPTFTRQAIKLFTDDEKRELIDLLATNPLAGDVIPEPAACASSASPLRGLASAAVAVSSTTTLTT